MVPVVRQFSFYLSISLFWRNKMKKITQINLFVIRFHNQKQSLTTQWFLIDQFLAHLEKVLSIVLKCVGNKFHTKIVKTIFFFKFQNGTVPKNWVDINLVLTCFYLNYKKHLIKNVVKFWKLSLTYIIQLAYIQCL